MIYELAIKDPKKIRAFWIDRAESAAKQLELPLPNIENMTTEQVEKYTKSLWDVLGVKYEK